MRRELAAFVAIGALAWYPQGAPLHLAVRKFFVFERGLCRETLRYAQGDKRENPIVGLRIILLTPILLDKRIAKAGEIILPCRSGCNQCNGAAGQPIAQRPESASAQLTAEDATQAVTAACAAISMSFTTSSGWETIARWFVGTSTVVAPMRLANRRSASGGIA